MSFPHIVGWFIFIYSRHLLHFLYGGCTHKGSWSFSHPDVGQIQSWLVSASLLHHVPSDHCIYMHTHALTGHNFILQLWKPEAAQTGSLYWSWRLKFLCGSSFPLLQWPRMRWKEWGELCEQSRNPESSCADLWPCGRDVQIWWHLGVTGNLKILWSNLILLLLI